MAVSALGATRRAALLALALATMLAATASPAGAKVATGKRVSPGAASQARHFWTPARMRRAQPVELGGRLRAPSRARAGTEPAVVADPTAPGARVNGVIFFNLLFGLGRCSGTSVQAPNFSLVFTAGHCVYNGITLAGLRLGFWLTRDWVFVPGYSYGQRPFGVFPAKWIGATRGWIKTSSPNHDVGVAVVGRNERGQRLAKAVGGTGIAWNLSPNQVFDVHGYPAEPPFNGRTLRLCSESSYLGHDPLSFSRAGPLNLGVPCQTNGGASGGGWTIDGERLNGITSYGHPDDPGTVFGPYFGKEVARLYRQAVRVR